MSRKVISPCHLTWRHEKDVISLASLTRPAAQTRINISRILANWAFLQGTSNGSCAASIKRTANTSNTPAFKMETRASSANITSCILDCMNKLSSNVPLENELHISISVRSVLSCGCILLFLSSRDPSNVTLGSNVIFTTPCSFLRLSSWLSASCLFPCLNLLTR